MRSCTLSEKSSITLGLDRNLIDPRPPLARRIPDATGAPESKVAIFKRLQEQKHGPKPEGTSQEFSVTLTESWNWWLNALLVIIFTFLGTTPLT
ncbi:uncharacterized protein VTP21DRAFT_10866 [Calcarisporiella thermophila]|uniref:uncharacterized protein n=1 Tax=Calcarisporiella thermophila TaxID=911321 RepID=UPI0037422025